jgi:ribosome assembly protein SQT1
VNHLQVDYLPIAWAIHRLGGILTPANAQYSASDLEYQLKNAGATCLFTCLPLLEAALQAAKGAGIPKSKIYLMELPTALVGPGGASSPGYKSVAEILDAGKKAGELEPLKWSKGEGKRRCAFICYSSGTSGLPKGVMISHYNVIANTMQIATTDEESRKKMKPKQGEDKYLENALGLLPLSHIYGLVVIAHASVWRGDGVVILPKFEFEMFLKAVQNYKVNMLYLVPPIIILMTKNKAVLDKFDLSHVVGVFTGAAPLGKETADDLNKIFPKWLVRQGYGLTETCTVVCSTPTFDIWLGSSGPLISEMEVRLVSVEGKEITGYDEPGELWVNSPSVVLGYLNNEKANRETFVIGEDGKRYMRTGDEAVIRKSPGGNEHIFITDRIKELIKVKVGLPHSPPSILHMLTHLATTGSASRSRRARSASPHASLCCRLRRDPRARRQSRRSSQSLRCQVTLRGSRRERQGCG